MDSSINTSQQIENMKCLRDLITGFFKWFVCLNEQIHEKKNQISQCDIGEREDILKECFWLTPQLACSNIAFFHAVNPRKKIA